MSELNIDELTASGHVEADVDDDYVIMEMIEEANEVTTELQSEELYYCTECGGDFDSIEAYTASHSGANGSCSGDKGIATEVEVIEETVLEEDEAEIDIKTEDSEEEAAEPPLWELVDVEPAIRMSAEQQTSKSEKYFCYDCHRIFENRLSAEEHACPQAEASGEGNEDASQVAFTKPKPTQRRTPRGAASGSAAVASPTTICGICNTVFGSTKSLKFHMRIHDKRAVRSIQDALPVGAHQQYSELDQFYCEICNKSFDQNLLVVHKQMHQSREQHMCGTCNRKFNNSTDYHLHMKIHEVNRNREQPIKASRVTSGADSKKLGFPCQYCDRVFGRPYEKVKHERVHTGEKPYECEVCGKTFRVAYSLTLHLRTHTNIRPYVCTTCNKRFKSHQVYSHHLRIHSSERQYACDMCAKTFRTSVQLYAHKNTHTKPFHCAVCNRPFASLYAVKAHMLTHKKLDGSNGSSASSSKGGTGANKFWCITCGAEYTRPFALRLHMKEAHGIQHQLDETAQLALAGHDKRLLTDETETAVLIAAAEADAAYGLNVVQNDVDVDGVESAYDENVEVSADAFDVDNFHSEEIITDWLK